MDCIICNNGHIVLNKCDNCGYNYSLELPLFIFELNGEERNRLTDICNNFTAVDDKSNEEDPFIIEIEKMITSFGYEDLSNDKESIADYIRSKSGMTVDQLKRFNTLNKKYGDIDDRLLGFINGAKSLEIHREYEEYKSLKAWYNRFVIFVKATFRNYRLFRNNKIDSLCNGLSDICENILLSVTNNVPLEKLIEFCPETSFSRPIKDIINNSEIGELMKLIKNQLD